MKARRNADDSDEWDDEEEDMERSNDNEARCVY